MITKDNGTIDYYDEDEYEAFVQWPLPLKRMTWVMKRNMCYALMTLAHPCRHKGVDHSIPSLRRPKMQHLPNKSRHSWKVNQGDH
jgi:hypothetical protein